jgi:hypothetical protein
MAMGVNLDENWRFRGFQVLTLENSVLRVDIIPELGAKIYNLIYKPFDQNILWHNPRIELRPVQFGANYNDNYAGGWDELFPNDAAVMFQGESLPDHGELWCQSWEYEILTKDTHEVSVRLHRRGSVTQTIMEKTITLRSDESLLRFHHKLTNASSRELLYLWKLHPSLTIGLDYRIDVPAKNVLIEELGSSFPDRFDGKVKKYMWPIVRDSHGKEHDMRTVLPPGSDVAEMHYCVDLTDGWCALTDTKRKCGFGLHFSKDVFNTVWVLMLYSGWRGLYHVILEPCNSYPYDLHKAMEMGRVGRLGAGKTLETDVVAVAYSDKTSVSDISSDGTVTG